MHLYQVDIRAKLQLFITNERLGQAEAAARVGISQSTICRVLQRGYTNRSKGRKTLENFFAENESKLNIPKELPSAITDAVAKVWDQTDDHAHILAGVIQSLDGLVPQRTGKEDGR